MIPPLLTKIKCKVVFIFYCIPSYLCMDHEGNEKFKGMQLLNLIRGFEMQRMKELQLGVLWQTSKHPQQGEGGWKDSSKDRGDNG